MNLNLQSASFDDSKEYSLTYNAGTLDEQTADGWKLKADTSLANDLLGDFAVPFVTSENNNKN